MIHETFNELRYRLIRVADEIPIESMWIHTLSEKLYKVVGHTILEATDEAGVIYCQPSNPEVSFTRSAHEWTEDVRTAGVIVKRFIKFEN